MNRETVLPRRASNSGHRASLFFLTLLAKATVFSIIRELRNSSPARTPMRLRRLFLTWENLRNRCRAIGLGIWLYLCVCMYKRRLFAIALILRRVNEHKRVNSRGTDLRHEIHAYLLFILSARCKIYYN